MGNMADGLNFQPRIGEPESSVGQPRGASVGTPQRPAGELFAFPPPNIPDTSSSPGPTALQSPVRWIYDFDPASGAARATFNGEVQFTSGGAGSNVLSFNTRSGAVVLTTADVTGAGGATSAQLASYLPLAGGVMTGPLTPAGLVGVVNGSNAAAGQVGEYMSASIAQASQIVVTTAAATNITQLALTAGDWDVEGLVGIVGGGGVVSAGVTLLSCFGWVGLTSAALGTQIWNGYGGAANINLLFPTGRMRVNVTAPTTVYLGFLATFSGGNNQAGGYGSIGARRMR